MLIKEIKCIMELQFRKAQVIENRYLLEGEKGQLNTLPELHTQNK